MTFTTRRGHHTAVQTDIACALQATRFRLMTELGRGATPMRLVNECFERALRELRDTCPGPVLPIVVERAVRAEFAPLAVASVA